MHRKHRKFLASAAAAVLVVMLTSAPVFAETAIYNGHVIDSDGTVVGEVRQPETTQTYDDDADIEAAPEENPDTEEARPAAVQQQTPAEVPEAEPDDSEGFSADDLDGAVPDENPVKSKLLHSVFVTACIAAAAVFFSVIFYFVYLLPLSRKGGKNR